MYIKKSSGPSTDPCGTPDTTGKEVDWAPPNTTAFLWRRTDTEQQVLSPPLIAVCCRLLDRSSRCCSFREKTANSGYFPQYMTNDGVVLPHGDRKWIVIVVQGGLIFEGKCIFENKPPPQSRSCLLLKKGGLIFGRIRYTFQMNVHTTGYTYMQIMITYMLTHRTCNSWWGRASTNTRRNCT